MTKLRLRDTATRYTTTRDRYGDLVNTSQGTINCLFRDISMLSQLGNREQIDIKGIFWFEPDAGVLKGDVIGYNGLLYRMEEVINAKNLLRTNQVQFIKCLCSLYRGIS